MRAAGVLPLAMLCACATDAGSPDAAPRGDARSSSDEPDARVSADAAPPPDADPAPTPDASSSRCEGEDAPDAEENAEIKPKMSDCDGNGYAISGELDGADDEDWFTYIGEDTGFCVVNPKVSTDAGIRVCLYVDNAGASITCRDSSEETSPGGKPGCCGDGSAQVYPESGWDDGATMLVRAHQGASGQCTPYTLDVHF